ncbi:MAG: HEAT repeat domain-containing protein [Methanoregula sp.]
MFPYDILVKSDDIPAMAGTRDVAGLVRALAVSDPNIQTAAIHALGQLGPDATIQLHAVLRKKKNRLIRLGAINALAEIKDPRSVPVLICMLHDRSSEIRWQVTLALGEIGDPAAIAPLTQALKDRDKYVRFGSARALRKIGYSPSCEEEYGWYCAGFQDWNALKKSDPSLVRPLIFLLGDRDREIRLNAIKILGQRGEKEAGPALLTALGDEDRQVRWEAMHAAERCGVSDMELPRGLYARPHFTKNPLIAGFLNFLLPGLGYGYLGKWWGIMIFQIDITATVWLFKFRGETDTYSLLFPLYLLLAIHAWYITKITAEETP